VASREPQSLCVYGSRSVKHDPPKLLLGTSHVDNASQHAVSGGAIAGWGLLCDLGYSLMGNMFCYARVQAAMLVWRMKSSRQS
jgi:hypothetical protein